MDEAVRRFRREASQELGDRQGAERRYSVQLRQAVVASWRASEDGPAMACTRWRRRWEWPR